MRNLNVALQQKKRFPRNLQTPNQIDHSSEITCIENKTAC